VRIISPDWAGIQARLQSWANGLVASDSNVLGVLLFGSLARDDHVPGSDADLIVIVKESRSRPAERPSLYDVPPIGLPVDVTVYTVDELRQLLADGLPFLHRAVSEGRWLATAKGLASPLPSIDP
jgi:predicted nucleotidyltransferase